MALLKLLALLLTTAAGEKFSEDLPGTAVTASLIQSSKTAVHPIAHPEPEEEGSAISQELGTDVVGDALEPTDHGSGALTHEAEEHHSDGYKSLLMFFGALLLGSSLLIVLERKFPSVPYTVAMFMAGVVFACWHYTRSTDSKFSWHSWFRSVEMWEAINPHMLFYTFLPPLIFSEAMKLDVQLAKKCFWQIFLTACPGVVLGTALVGTASYYVLPYDWSWSVCFTFGSVLSATDPVAVVALFNTLGVSPRLTMLVSGESLMNDGTAIVIFSLMLKLALGASLDAYSVATFFAHMTLTSVVVGGAIGFLTVGIIGLCSQERFHSDAMIQVITTLCCSYLAFFLAESEASCSGVLSTVSAGFVVACYAWPLFSSFETIEVVWETVEFVGNTVIFFLAGLLFADSIFENLGLITWRDFGWMLVLYAMLIAIRAAMLCILWIPLNKVGGSLDWREGVAMCWSGLRGAVSLALAIVIDEEPGISTQMGGRIMFHVGGIAALTLLVNATTAAPLLRYLGLAKTSKAGEAKLASFAEHLSEVAGREVATIKKGTDVRLAGANEEMLRVMVPALQVSEKAPELSSADAETEQTYREAFLHGVQHQYWHDISIGVVPRRSDSARILLNSVQEGMAQAWESLNDWESVSTGLEKRSCLSVMAGSMLFSGEEMDLTMQKVYCVTCFLRAHEKAREELPRFFKGTSLTVQQLVDKESKAQCQEAEKLLASLPADSVELGRTQMAARKILNHNLQEVEHLKERGMVAASEAAKLSHDVHNALRDLLSRKNSEWLDMKTAKA